MTAFVIWIIGALFSQMYVEHELPSWLDALLMIFAWPLALGNQLRNDIDELKAARKIEKEVDFHADK